VNNSNPTDTVLDFFVYAPLGAALHARKHIEGFAEQGRQAVEGRVDLYRTIGEFAVQQARQRSDLRFGALSEWLENLGFGAEPAIVDEASGVTPESSDRPDSTEQLHDESDLQPEPVAGYDQWTAATIVKLLPSWAGTDLAAIRLYELRRKGRRTVIARIDQLLDRPASGR
jgi:hypothetical protein